MFDQMSGEARVLLPEQRGYLEQANELYQEIERDRKIKGSLDAFGIIGGVIVLCDPESYKAVSAIRVGMTCADLVRSTDTAAEAAKHALDPTRPTSREYRLSLPRRGGASAVRGSKHIISCMLVADPLGSPLEDAEMVEVEDLSELFVFALVRRLRQKSGIYEFDHKLVRFLSLRYDIDTLDSFSRFI